MTKLLKNRVLSGLSKETVKTYSADLKAARSKFVATPIIDDMESQTWEKMGPVKRAQATETLKVLKNYEAELPAHLSLSIADNGLSVYDNADDMITLHKEAIEDLKRLKLTGGATGLNMIKCIEEHIYLQADQTIEWAIGARNFIEKLPRSSDRKSNVNKNDSSSTSS